MAKPATPTPWATNTNYSTGPDVGTPTKVAVPSATQQDGWIPDQKPPAQWENYWHNEMYQYALWVFDGSSAMDEDAHIVETDANGLGRFAYLLVGPRTASSSISLSVVGSSAHPAIQVTGNNDTGAAMTVAAASGGSTNCLECTGGSFGGSGVKGTGGGGGDGVEGIGNAAGDGVSGQGGTTSGKGGAFLGGTPNGIGVQGLGSGTGYGGDFLGGASATYGVRAIGQGSGSGIYGFGGTTGKGAVLVGGSSSGIGADVSSTSGNAVEATATAGIGVDAQGGGVGGDGVRGTTTDTSANGIKGTTAGSATTSACGVRGDGLGSGVGCYGKAVDGYGVVAESDTSSPTRAALRVVPQDDDPTSPQEGDIAYNSTTHEFRVRENLGSWETLWSTPGGRVSDTDTVASYNLTSTSYATISSITITAPRAGNVWIWVSAVLDENTAVSCDLRVRNTTTSTTAWEKTGVDTQMGVIPCGIVTPVAVNSGSNTIALQGKVPGNQYDFFEINMLCMGML